MEHTHIHRGTAKTQTCPSGDEWTTITWQIYANEVLKEKQPDVWSSLEHLVRYLPDNTVLSERSQPQRQWAIPER